jgi:hypothetical protein
LLVVSASCASAQFKHAGATPGALDPAETQRLLASLRTMPRLDPSLGVVSDGDVMPTNPMTLYFGSAADGNLVDLAYLLDATESLEKATIRASMIQREDRPSVLAEQQNLWVVAFVATKPRHPGNCRFSLHVLHESIAPVPSLAEQGIVAALTALVKVEAKRPELKSTDVSFDFRFPVSCPERPADGTPNVDKADKGESGATPIEPLRLLGTAADLEVYAGIRKLSLFPGTTNRIVLSPDLRTAEEPLGPPASRTKTRGTTVTFRNASRPSLRATVGVGARVDFRARPRLNGVTQPWSPYDPDLYLLGHWIPPFSAQWQLEAEWYPSVFLGTNLVTRTPLTDLVFGVRVPAYLIKAGLAAGVSWGRYDFKVDPTCKAKDCETDSTRNFAGFLAADYEF